jgi:biopolymer transport protein ExbD
VNVRRRHEEVEIPTASMADIAFLLIIIFMTTTVFAETMGINFRVPPRQEQEEVTGEEESEEAVSIRIDDQGNVYVDREPVERARVDDEIRGYLVPKLTDWPEKPILVTAEPEAPYGTFVEVYDALRQVEKALHESGELPQGKSLKVSVLSLEETERLKALFGEGIFG